MWRRSLIFFGLIWGRVIIHLRISRSALLWRLTRRVRVDIPVADSSACAAGTIFGVYGSRAARQAIDFLEGDVVVVTVRRLAHLWYGMRIPFFVDNMVFEKSGEAGRSRVDRIPMVAIDASINVPKGFFEL